MIKKVLFIVISLSLFVQTFAKADEGMWLLSLIKEINYQEMRKMGLKLTPEQIYSTNQSCLKDAVVALDYGQCTAEIISKEGLLLTNHHCGYEDIQSHSSLANNYLADGFWAKTKDEELTNPGKTATLLVRMEDVTAKIMAELNENMTEEDREAKIEEIIDSIKTEATKDTHYEAQVKKFYEGNQYFLFVLETFKDIRLVGAPPESIGKFGHDTDNWMWPRHTGDFSIFRIYTGPDGKPAEYSDKNIPYVPKHHIPVSLKGVNNGDFTMVLGFPGTTNRYLTAAGVTEVVEDDNPIRVALRGAKQQIIMEDMNASEKVKIQYSAKYATSSNYWKYSIGQNQGVRNLDVIARKKAEEDELIKWIESTPENKEKYGYALDKINSVYADRKETNRIMKYIEEGFLNGAEVVMFAYQGNVYWAGLRDAQGDVESLNLADSEFKKNATEFFKDFNPETDKKILAKLFAMCDESLPEGKKPEIFDEVYSKYDGNFEKFADAIFAESIFADENRLQSFIEKPSLDELFQQTTVMKIAFIAEMLYDLIRESPENFDRNSSVVDIIIQGTNEYFANYSLDDDKKVLVELLQNYDKTISAEKLPAFLKDIKAKYAGNYTKYVDDIFANSSFVSQEKFTNMLKYPIHESVYANSVMLQFADNASGLYDALKIENNKGETEKRLLQLQLASVNYFLNYTQDSTKKALTLIMQKVYANSSKENLPDIFNIINSKYKGNIEAFVNDVYSKSIFTDQARMSKFLSSPKLKTLENDLAFKTLKSLQRAISQKNYESDLVWKFYTDSEPFIKMKEIENDIAYRTMVAVVRFYYQVMDELDAVQSGLDKAKRDYVAAILKKSKTPKAPDANSTIRLTYGKVGDYEPKDAVAYKHYTTLKGVMEKEDANNPEFEVSERLKELYKNKDYGVYGKNGELPVCFTTNNDITGGNSGSPVLNGNGHLVGIAFDGNWEAMSGDIAYEKYLQKCICVDIRYVLFVIGKYAGATNLINEMTIIK